MKTLSIQQNIGSVRHAVSFHDGEKKHQDGSPFFDLRTFGRKRDCDKFVEHLKAQGFIET